VTIARNVLSDWARRWGREVPMSDFIELLADHRARPELTSLDGVETLDPARSRVVARYVETLSPDLRLVHQHRFVRAQSQRDAARTIGITRQRLRTLEARLVKGLRRALGLHRRYRHSEPRGGPGATAEGTHAMDAASSRRDAGGILRPA
jgi:DNA-directed RNA polymerase specialized sigma24 family protein